MNGGSRVSKSQSECCKSQKKHSIGYHVLHQNVILSLNTVTHDGAPGSLPGSCPQTTEVKEFYKDL